MKLKLKKNNKTTRREAADSAKVFSYYSSANLRNSNRATSGNSAKSAKKNQFKRILRDVPTTLSVLVIVGSCLFATTLDPSQTTVDVVPLSNANQAVNTQVYETFISQQLSTNIMNRSKLLVNTRVIESRALEAFPELSGIAITVPLVSRHSVIALSFEQPALIIGTPTAGYVVNDGGRVFGEANQLPSSILRGVPVVEDKADVELAVGALAIPSDLVTFVKDVSVQAKESDLEVVLTRLPAVANELHLQLKDQPYIIKLNTERSARSQLGSFLAYRSNQEEQGWIAPSEYIDVRVAGKVYVK